MLEKFKGRKILYLTMNKIKALYKIIYPFIQKQIIYLINHIIKLAQKIRRYLTKTSFKRAFVAGLRSLWRWKYLIITYLIIAPLLLRIVPTQIAKGALGFDVLILIAIAIFALLVNKEIVKDVVIIEPFEVPEQFKKDGYTGKVITNKLIDKIHDITHMTTESYKPVTSKSKPDKTPSLMAGTNFETLESQMKSFPEMQVPGFGISLSSFVNYIKWEFSRNKPTTITGEIMIDDQAVYLTTRISGESNYTSPPFDFALNNLPNGLNDSLQKAAGYILEQIEPFLYASYTFPIDKKKSERIFREIISKGLKKEKFDVYFQWGKLLADDNKYEEAIEKYDKALEINPKDPIALYNKGVALYYQSEYANALKAFEEAINFDHKYAKPWNGKGVALYMLEKHDESIKAFDEAIEIDPNDAAPWNNKGYALSQLGRYDDAIKAFDKAIEIDPNYALAWNNKGGALHKLEDYEDAIKAYDNALEIDSNYEIAKENKELALLKLEESTNNPKE